MIQRFFEQRHPAQVRVREVDAPERLGGAAALVGGDDVAKRRRVVEDVVPGARGKPVDAGCSTRETSTEFTYGSWMVANLAIRVAALHITLYSSADGVAAMIREPRPPLEPMRDEADLRRLLSAIAQWENRPHNKPGSDKTWIERLLEEDRRFYESAVRVR